MDDVLADFAHVGYAVAHGLYEDDDGRQDRHGMVGIVRNKVLTDRQPSVMSLGSRNAVYLPFAVPTLAPGFCVLCALSRSACHPSIQIRTLNYRSLKESEVLPDALQIWQLALP